MKRLRIERKTMDLCGNSKESYGRIILEKLAKPETVKVRFLNETIIPMSFNIYGHPIFSKEQFTIYKFKEKEKAKELNVISRIVCEITYEEDIFEEEKTTFDTVDGIRRELRSLESLNKVIQSRRRYQMSKSTPLRAFIVFGKYYFDMYGDVQYISDKTSTNIKVKKPVEYMEDIEYVDEDKWIAMSKECIIPPSGERCKCCGKEFTIDDLTENPCTIEKGEYYHRTCFQEYRKILEITEFTDNLMSLIYSEADYEYEIIPNGYCSRDLHYSIIPWFEIKTIHGMIQIGWRKRVISIEWQEDFKNIDFEELFKTEDVTKGRTNNKYYIHAWGKDKAYEYLKLVLNEVDPNYTRRK